MGRDGCEEVDWYLRLNTAFGNLREYVVLSVSGPRRDSDWLLVIGYGLLDILFAMEFHVIGLDRCAPELKKYTLTNNR